MPSDNVEEIAKQLVRAAQGAATREIDSKQIDRALERIEKRMDASDELMVRKLDELKSAIELSAMRDAIRDARNRVFNYPHLYEIDRCWEDSNGRRVIGEILSAFYKGEGYFLPNAVFFNQYSRDAVVAKIFDLLGTKPRLAKHDDGQYVICYE